MKKPYFTLVELMIVVAIIAILSGLAMPFIMGAMRSANITKATAEMKGLQQAIERYYNGYGELPLIGSASSTGLIDPNEGSTKDYEELLATLACKKYAGKTSPSTKFNKRNIVYWDGPNNFTSTDFKFVDPWGKYYVIWMDHKDKNKIGTSDSGDNVVLGRVHVSSYGPDETQDITPSNMRAFWNNTAGDLATWNTK